MENFDKKIQNKLSSYQHEEAPSDASVEKMMQKLDEVLPQQTEVKSMHISHKTKPLFGFVYKLAASIAIFLLIGYAFYALNEVTVIVGNTAQQEVTLPDGSKVIMNSGSELRYHKLRWYYERKVDLTGEAFFEVAKGERFTVDSELGTTQVLGTSFNIFSRKNKYQVMCRTGRVQVNSKNTDAEVLLTPGKGVTLKNQVLQSFEFDLSEERDWRRGAFHFEAALFESVIAELERQYDVKVNFPRDYGSLIYSGYFDNSNLDKALKLVCEPVGLEYQQNGRQISLTPLE